MKYSELINYIKFTVHPNKEKIKKEIYVRYKKKRTKKAILLCTSLFCVAILTCGLYSTLRLLPLGKDCDIPVHLTDISPIAAVRPTQTNENNIISANTAFKVTTTDAVSKKEFREIFKLSPESEYTLTKHSGNTFTVNFEKPLKADTVYTVKSMSETETVFSWAYQTETAFEITNVYPNSGSINPTDAVYIDFSHSNVENFIENFTIYPAVSGTFEQYGKRWMFIPSTEFEDNTLYTVTINDTVSGGENETLSSNYSFSFMTFSSESDSDIYLNYSSQDLIDTFRVGTLPAASFVYNNRVSGDADIEIYKIPSSDEFIKLHKNHAARKTISSAISEELNNYDKVYSFTADIETDSGYGYVQYSETAESGFYISKLSIGKYDLYHFYQVNDLAVYTLSSNGNYTVWVNNSISGLCEKNAQILFDTAKPIFTDDNGIATLSSANKSGEYKYLTVRASDSSVYVSRIKATGADSVLQPASDYRLYLQTNSSIYNAGGAVKVFGFIQPISESTVLPDTLILKTSWDGNYTEAELNSNGCFDLEFELPDYLSKGMQSISIVFDDTEALTASFEVSENNAEYNLRYTTDKESYYSGETINYTVYATTNDGVPIEDLEIFTDDGESIFTDKDGIASYSKSVEVSATEYIVTDFSVALPDSETMLRYSHAVKAFPGEIYLETQQTDTDITVSVFDTESQKPCNASLNVELHRVSYEKKEKSTLYDPYKQSDVVSYYYEEIDEIISEETYVTENGKCTFDIQSSSFRNVQLYYKITAESEGYPPVSINHSIFNALKLSETNPYVLATDKNSYKISETAQINVYKEGFRITGGTLLLSYATKNNVINRIYTDLNDISFEIGNDLVGDVYIYGAYFDGEDIHMIESGMFSVSENSVELSVSTDKAQYLPGETVSLQISAQNSDGTPIAASVNINVNDEFVDTAHSYSYKGFYNDISAISSKYTVNAIPESSDSDEQDGTKSIPDFKPSPFSRTVTTDEFGNATVSFKLPEYSNTWSVSAVGIFGNAIGNSQTTIHAEDDFYIETNIDDKIKSTEDCIIPFKFISRLTSTEECAYGITLYKDGIMIDTYADISVPNRMLTQNFGKLKAGNYKVRISAKSDSFADAADFEFSINTADTLTEYSAKALIENEVEINGALFESDAKATIYDENLEFCYSIAEKLSKLPKSNAAQACANAFLKGSELTQQDLETIYNANQYSDVKSQAVFYAIFGEYFDKATSKAQLEEVLYKSHDDLTVICCYLAMTSFDSPVLNELYDFNERISELDIEEKIYLALAFSYAGDYTAAYRIYNEHISPKIISANGIAQYDYDGTSEEITYLTATITHLSGKLSVKDAKDIAKSLLLNNTNVEKYSLELFAFIKNYTSGVMGTNEINITYSDGSKEKIEFSKLHGYSFVIPKEKLENVKFQAVKGVSSVSVFGDIISDAETEHGYTD